MKHKNNFSATVKEILSTARDEAIRTKTNYIGPSHLILGLAKMRPDVFDSLLSKGHRILPELVQEIETGIRDEEKGTTTSSISAMKSKFRLFNFSAPRPAALFLNRQAEKAIRGSVTEARNAHSGTVEPEHLFLSILKNTTAIHPG